MDGLSIATSVFALLDVAISIKASIEKLGQNRRRLRDLSTDIIDDLVKLQKFCETRQLGLKDTPELEESLLNLQRDLYRAALDCEKLIPSGGKGVLGRLHGVFKEWKVADDVEDDLRRLKSNIQSSILWTCLYGVARSELAISREHEVLVSRSEERWTLRRFDATFGESICHRRSDGLCAILGHREPRDVDRQYLRLKVESITHALESLRISSLCASDLSFSLSDYIPSYTGHPNEVATVISSTVQVWEVFRNLQAETMSVFISDWLEPCLVLADTVLSYGFGDLTYRIFHEGARILGELIRVTPNVEGVDTLLLFYTWTLMRQSVMCTNGFEKLDVNWKMVSLRHRLYNSPGTTYSKSQRLVWLCRALTELASTYFWIGNVDDALSCCERALKLAHPSHYDESSAGWKQLEVYTSSHASWTVAVGTSHSVSQALAFGLLLHAKLLHARNQLDAACHSGHNAVLVVRSLHERRAELPRDFHFFDWHLKWLQESMAAWVEIPRSPYEPRDDDEQRATPDLLDVAIGQAL